MRKSRRRLRSFQKELLREAQGIAGGNGKRVVTAAVTPGGGKSYGAAIFAKELLKAGTVDTVVWAVPRNTLAAQAAEDLPLRINDNNAPLIRDRGCGVVGYAATYQAIEAAVELHELTAKKHKTLLIVDEFHHLAINDKTHGSFEEAWCRAVQRVADHCAVVLAMSGTMYRADRKRIAFVNYGADGKPGRADVVYGRNQAIEEGAKLRIIPKWVGGKTLWEAAEGEDVESPTAPADPRVRRRMLGDICQNGGFVGEAALEGIHHWAEHRKENKKAQCIVVAKTMDLASDVYDELRAMLPGVKIDLAISRDTAKSRRAVKRYRKRKIDVLVSVGMAHEGLDAPSTTHVICLRGYRSAPYCEQCADRASRIDPGNPHKTACWFFLPDVDELRAAWRDIEDELTVGVKTPGAPGPTGGPGPGLDTEPDFVLRHATTNTTVDLRAVTVVAKYREAFPGVGVDEKTILEMNAAGAINWPEVPDQSYDPDEEQRLRRQANRLCSARDRRRGEEPGTANRLLFNVFGKSRTKMGVQQLREVVAWLLEDEKVMA